MTKKDYIRIANAIGNVEFASPIDKAELVLALGDTLKDDNPKFDIAKFARACGYGHATTENNTTTIYGGNPYAA